MEGGMRERNYREGYRTTVILESGGEKRKVAKTLHEEMHHSQLGKGKKEERVVKSRGEGELNTLGSSEMF